MKRLGQRRGTTLLEVMVALGILATTYVALLEVHSGAIRLSRYGRQATIASLLAQARMEELEWKLEKEGFPDSEQKEEGNFEEDGFPAFRWQLRISKVELPLGAALETALSSMLGGGDKAAEKSKSLFGTAGQAGIPGMSGATGGGMASSLISSFLNPEALRSQVDALAKLLEESIRQVELTVSWGKGEEGERLVLVTHLVRVPQAPSAAGSAPLAQPGMPQAPGGQFGLPASPSTPGLPINPNVSFGVGKAPNR